MFCIFTYAAKVDCIMWVTVSNIFQFDACILNTSYNIISLMKLNRYGKNETPLSNSDSRFK